MNEAIVIGLDSSTQSTKAIAWDAKGNILAEGRASIPMSQPQLGYAEQDVEDWWTAACATLTQVCTQINTANIAGIAISNQRETVGFIDDQDCATHPAIVWLDERARDLIVPLNAAFPDGELHKITGKPADLTPVIYRLAWMQENARKVIDKTASIVDVNSFLMKRMTGMFVTSWTSADPFGIFDIEEKQWSAPILKHLGLSVEKFPKLIQPGKKIGTLTAKAAQATGLPENTIVYTAGGDGQCAGLGVNAVRAGRVYLNLGTAIVIGIKSKTPALSNSWRTMTSPTGEGYFLENVLRAGTFFIDWFVKNFVSEEPSAKNFADLEAGAKAIKLGSNGLTVCPYLSGCMNPHWNANARASFIGLGPQHTKYHLYRAILESLTHEIARTVEDMQKAGHAPRKIIVVGGGANSKLWSQMIADACGLPLIKNRTIEASALGAGISAAVGAGWFANFEDAANAMTHYNDETIQPNPNAKSDWCALGKRLDASYHATNAEIFSQ